MNFYGNIKRFGETSTVTGGNNNNMIINIICGVILVILIIILIICLVTNNDSFKNDDNDNESYTGGHDLMLVHRNGCPYSEKMKKQLENNNMKVGKHKVKSIIGLDHELAKKHNVLGTPGVICQQTGATVMGFMDLDKLEKELDKKMNVNEHFTNDHDDVNSIGLYFFHRAGCPYSEKMKKQLENNNMKIGDKFNIVRIIDSSDPIANKHRLSATPTIVHAENGVKVEGLMELDQLEKELNKKMN